MSVFGMAVMQLMVGLLTLDTVRETAGLQDTEQVKADHWRREGQSQLVSNLRKTANTNVAKNIVFFLGDGMSISTITASRIYKGQKARRSGEEEVLEFEKFPYVSLAKTYALDRQTSDSANSATAYLCGVKANFATVGVDGRVTENDCSAAKDTATHVPSILQWAQDAGKATGFVTTTRVTHATPSGLYAHTASRYWESAAPDGCPDIAAQLVDSTPGKNIQVILGGGRREFAGPRRKDGRNLTADWFARKDRNSRAVYITDRLQLDSVDPQNTDFLLGLFNDNHIPYVVDRSSNDPSLVDMMDKAIRILQRHPSGFFLLVEGGRIDHAHHNNTAMRALEETIEMDNAVQRAVQMTDERDTLVVVTADHSHVFTISGYPPRGHDILGVADYSDMDNLSYTTLSYANGPGYKGVRQKNHSETETRHQDYRQDTLAPLEDETHGADDVAVFSRGPMAHLFTGVYDQTYIPYAMAYAACIGPNADHCSPAVCIKGPSVTLLLAVVWLGHQVLEKRL